MIIKSKLSSNPIYQGSASEMILIQFFHSQSVIRERKRGEDWEIIWKRFGDAKHNSQKLERKGEINLPKECLKGFVIRRAMFSIKNGRLTACFFICRGHGSKEKEHRKFKEGLAKQF